MACLVPSLPHYSLRTLFQTQQTTVSIVAAGEVLAVCSIAVGIFPAEVFSFGLARVVPVSLVPDTAALQLPLDGVPRDGHL